MDALQKANFKTLFSAGLGALGQIAEGFAVKNAAAFQATMLRQEAALRRLQALDARRAGRELAQRIQRETARRIGSQKAALAANGIVVGRDTALDLIKETAGVGTLDALTALDNAERRAISILNRAALNEAEANIKRAKGRDVFLGRLGAAGRTLIVGADTVSRRIADFRRGRENGNSTF